MKLSSKPISKSFIRQITFSTLAILLFVILLVVIIYSTAFIIQKSESALDVSVSPAPSQRFDLQGYEQLETVKQRN